MHFRRAPFEMLVRCLGEDVREMGGSTSKAAADHLGAGFTSSVARAVE